MPLFELFSIGGRHASGHIDNLFTTVPVKCKLTVSTRNSILDTRCFSSFEFRVSSIEYRVSSFEYRVSSFEYRVSSFESLEEFFEDLE